MDNLNELLKQNFGFACFKKGQEEVIRRIMKRESATAIFPTGAGKSLCYQLPGVLLPGITLVVSPLLSLIKDQLDFLQEHNIPAARLDSSLGKVEYNRVISRAKMGELKILMISVERFRNERFRIHLGRMNISLLVVDEAHCISEWGHNFRPEYLKLPLYRQEFHISQVLLLTATATREVVKDMSAKFGIPPGNVTITGFYRKNLFLQISPVAQNDMDRKLLAVINENPGAPSIVYVTLQKTAERVATMLSGQGIRAHSYHGGMKNEEREDIQNRFMAGDISCVAATIAFGMGIDKRDIRRVIHYDLPKSVENYSQEIGRSGRDGEPAFCEVLANRDNINILENFVYGDTPEKMGIFTLLKDLKAGTDTWEVKNYTLSRSLDIRYLPLKTLLVYLDMEGIIKPLYTYFENYSFRYLSDPQAIAERFKGERRDFVRAIIGNCQSKKVWTYVDIEGIVSSYRAERKRVITALEYFDEQGWIELQAKQSVDVYRIVNQSFIPEILADKLYGLFKEKGRHEISRITHMIDFFQSTSCLSAGLASYFGETIPGVECGHCSVCQTGPVVIEASTHLPALNKYDFNELAGPILSVSGGSLSAFVLTKFFCGINSPCFYRWKASRFNNFGVFERYPFREVMAWVKGNSL